MILRDLTPAQVRARLRASGLVLNTGAFRIRLGSETGSVAKELATAYANHRIESEDALHHLRVEIRTGPWRVSGRDRGVVARVSGADILGPFPSALAYPMLESILNWCIAKTVLRFIVFHAGAVERGGQALILTGPSGSGKSTLTAALSRTGWRLVSDEMVLLRPGEPLLAGNPRPISLKNESIALIRALDPDAVFSEAYEGTTRGTISFLCPNADAAARSGAPAIPRRVIFPIFRAGATTRIEELARAKGFMKMVENSVNYSSTLRRGFETLAGLTDLCRFYELTFGDFEAGLAAIEEIAPDQPSNPKAAPA